MSCILPGRLRDLAQRRQSPGGWSARAPTKDCHKGGRQQQVLTYLGGCASLPSAGRSKSRRLVSARAAAGPRAATAAMNSSAALAYSAAHPD